MRFPKIDPGEIDHQIAQDLLIKVPTPVWDSYTLAACTRLYHRYVEPAAGVLLPDSAFCDLPRWIFLEYLVQHCAILLFGSNEPDCNRLEPAVLASNVRGWDTPRLHAFSNSVSAVFRALLDRRRLQELNCLSMTTLVKTLADENTTGEKQTRLGCYFGVDYRALPYAPWRRGTIYLYARTHLPLDFQSVAYKVSVTGRPILPLARLHVDPWDWPLLDKVQGFDAIAQNARQNETFDGYPWPKDSDLHPHQWKRPQVERARAYLEENFAGSASLAHLGRRLGVSPFSLLRMFQAAVGVSPHEYQTWLRIIEAKRLLRRGLPIAQTAAQTGFCDQTHLTRHFRRFVGLTPGRYLRMQESPIRILSSPCIFGT